MALARSLAWRLMQGDDDPRAALPCRLPATATNTGASFPGWLCRQARREVAERTLCNSLVLALACGVLVAAVLLTCGRTFLAGMGTAPQLLHPAWQYLSIRQAACPAS